MSGRRPKKRANRWCQLGRRLLSDGWRSEYESMRCIVDPIELMKTNSSGILWGTKETLPSPDWGFLLLKSYLPLMIRYPSGGPTPGGGF